MAVSKTNGQVIIAVVGIAGLLILFYFMEQQQNNAASNIGNAVSALINNIVGSIQNVFSGIFGSAPTQTPTQVFSDDPDSPI